MSDSTAEQDRIEDNLRTTRSRMDQRLNELQGKLAPGQIVEDFMDYIRNNGGGEFAQNLLASAQKNPLPAVVAGVGLTWLIVSNSRSQVNAGYSGNAAISGNVYRPYSSSDGQTFQSRLRSAEAEVSRNADDTDDSYADRLNDARGKAMGMARNAQDTAASYAARVQSAIANGMESLTQGSHDLRDRAGDAAGRLKDSAQQFGGQMRDGVQYTGSQMRDTAQQVGGQLMQGARSAQQSGSDLLNSITSNPIALGALGLAGGALLAMLLPRTSQEDEALGEFAGKARETVRDAAQGLVDQGSALAQQAAQTAKDSAASHGFTTGKSVEDVAADLKSGDLVKNAKEVVQDVLKSGSETPQKNG